MAEFEIKNLQDLIRPILDKKKYVGAKLSKLTAAGDNYGSLMLSVNITVEDGQGKTEQVNAVAKLLPQNEFIQQLFNSQRTFRNEVGFYQILAPCLREFQKEQGLTELFNAFPAYYGARISLDPASNKVDADGALLIKNIKDEGFSNVDRTIGFDLAQTELILEKMAELHGTTLALKVLKPEYFNDKLGHLFEEFTMFDVADNTPDKMTESIISAVKDDEFCARHLEKIKNTLTNNSKNIHNKNSKDLQQGPFLAFVHHDMWSNNIMVKIVDDRTIDVKFVDFQIYEFSSLTRDVVFFLFISVQFPVIRQHSDSLLRFYYDSLVKYLKKLKYDTSVFSFEAFIDDMKKMIQATEFYHIMLMLAPIYAGKDDSKEVEDVGRNDMIDQRAKVSKLGKQKGYFIVEEFIRRGWI